MVFGGPNGSPDLPSAIQMLSPLCYYTGPDKSNLIINIGVTECAKWKRRKKKQKRKGRKEVGKEGRKERDERQTNRNK